MSIHLKGLRFCDSGKVSATMTVMTTTAMRTKTWTTTIGIGIMSNSRTFMSAFFSNAQLEVTLDL